jgi:pimeloyl-ACP methyl ester carboxylesterase
MGGWISQLVALDYPARVASLTLIATTPGDYSEREPDPPGPSEDSAEAHSEEEPPTDWSDRAAAIDALVAGERPLAGTHPFEEARKRAIAARVVERTVDLAATTNHFSIEGDLGWRGRLGAIAAPTLILHGTVDPFFPLGNGEALAREIPGARLLPLAGMGHEYPPRAVWDTAIPAIVAHTAG